MASINSSGSSSSSSTSSYVGEEVIVKQASMNAGDTCTWYAEGSCTRPRTCYDCLNVLVDENCAIDYLGACASVSSAISAVGGYYTSLSFSYCPSDDSTCASCIQNWTNEYEMYGIIRSPSVCRGESNCICIASCEVSSRNNSVITEMCMSNSADSQETGSNNSTNSVTSADLLSVIGVGLAFCLGFGLLSLAIRKCAKRLDRRDVFASYRTPDARQTYQNRPPSSGPRLNLSGWTSMREKLIVTERVYLAEIQRRPTPQTENIENLTHSMRATSEPSIQSEPPTLPLSPASTSLIRPNVHSNDHNIAIGR